MKNFLDTVLKNGPAGRKRETERVTGLGRRKREETAKWNQMTALRFQTEGRHQTSLASLRGLREGEQLERGNNVRGRQQYTVLGGVGGLGWG